MSSLELRRTCVSAPGKVLLTGGYLVLDEQYSGLVLASTARFYSTVTPEPSTPEDASSVASQPGDERVLFPVVIESPQFVQLVRGCVVEDSAGRYHFQLQRGSDRNAYVEETMLCAVNGIAGLAQFEANNTFQQLHDAKLGVHITLRGDNDFYSQVRRLQDANKSLNRSNLKALESFLPPTMEERGEGKLVALKTGMGSSAALVTSLVAALVSFFVPTTRFNEREEDLELVHNLAQLSHCYVQRKIGSGFDVSTACFGSQRYSRFPATILSPFTSEESLIPKQIAKCMMNRELWKTADRVNSFQLPTSFRMMMGDVSSGSATVSMVRKVLKWKEEHPEHALQVMNALHLHNLAVERGFDQLAQLESSGITTCNWKIMASTRREQWGVVDPVVGGVMTGINESFAQVRALLREMGTSAGVPIEPPEQTEILDATLNIPGVLIAGVPGAGGHDAICVVVVHEQVLQVVEELWLQWPSTHPDSMICPLLCDVDRGTATSRFGLQLHDAE